MRTVANTSAVEVELAPEAGLPVATSMTGGGTECGRDFPTFSSSAVSLSSSSLSLSLPVLLLRRDKRRSNASEPVLNAPDIRDAASSDTAMRLEAALLLVLVILVWV